MVSTDGRFCLVFNGEIYNHLALRVELDKARAPNSNFSRSAAVTTASATRNWRGLSDTETLLAGFEHWGVEATLIKTVGMFAFALWDVHERTLYLARDRFGEKPLYYGWAGSGMGRAFVFGSELKALRAFEGFSNPVCRGALAQYMRFKYVPAPLSIYQEIFKLEPGCLLSIQGVVPFSSPARPLRAPANHTGLTLKRWWSLANVVQMGAAQEITNEGEALSALERRLIDAVRLQSSADVPLGAFLSGGVDSSLIVALMQRTSWHPVNTFTVGFEDASFDESSYARQVAKHLGTCHTELFVGSSEVQAVIGRLPIIYDEPFADSSQIPTHLVCRSAQQHVTVVLSGDAGDELFGGYDRYFWGPRIWGCLSQIPFAARRALGAAITALPVAAWDAVNWPVNVLRTGSSGIAHLGDKAHKLAAGLAVVHNFDDLYLSLVSEWQNPSLVVVDNSGPASGDPIERLNDLMPTTGLTDWRLRMMYCDTLTYLPDDILCKVDRAAMSTSLETRVPFLDHRVAELAWRLPVDMKFRGGEGKWALRQVLYKYVPRELIERPTVGFSIPIGRWLRGSLRPWAEALSCERRLDLEGYFNPGVVRELWAEHLSERRDHTAKLWCVLMFQAWLESQL
jgi:asparagine synthase (glutamine-hydrolysing)